MHSTSNRRPALLLPITRHLPTWGRRIASYLLVVTWILTSVPLDAQLAFPGAEGFGADITSGGRGGSVLIVDRLDDDLSNPDPGTLRHAIEQTYPRTIVFQVAGYITLKAPLVIDRDNDDVTIAGQTAPGDGITLRGAGLILGTDVKNVIVRHIRFRHGAHYGFIDTECDPPGSKNECESDAIQIDDARRVIFDHISASWSIDELLTVSESKDVTIQWSSFVEPLHNSRRHPENFADKHGHGRGPLIRGADRVTFHHNIIAHADTRSPQVSAKGGTYETNVLVQNNLIYGPVNGASKFNYSGSDNGEDRRVMYLGNFYRDNYNEPAYETRSRGISGFETVQEPIQSSDFEGIFYVDDKPSGVPWIDLYLSGNVADNPWKFSNKLKTYSPPSDWELYGGDANKDNVRVTSPPFAIPAMTYHSAAVARDRVRGFAGAQVPNLDAVDERVYFATNSQYATATGRLIDDEEDVGSYPLLATPAAAADSDSDGLPDGWELAEAATATGLFNLSDGNLDGYYAIDDYINELGVNCAAGKTATQDSLGTSAKYAVDNDLTLNNPSAAAWTAQNTSSWWQVSLGFAQDLYGLKIYKSDAEAIRFQNVVVKVYLGTTLVHTEGPFTNTSRRTHYVKFSQPVVGDRIRIERTATNGYLGLRLAEVQVYCTAWPRPGVVTGPGPANE